MGPSLGFTGSFNSSSRENITRGSVNVIVFPDPVNAMPIMSRPDNAQGKPWACMGVGLTIPFANNPSKTGLGNRIRLNDWIGGGIFSPSTNICSLFLMALFSFFCGFS